MTVSHTNDSDTDERTMVRLFDDRPPVIVPGYGRVEPGGTITVPADIANMLTRTGQFTTGGGH